MVELEDSIAQGVWTRAALQGTVPVAIVTAVNGRFCWMSDLYEDTACFVHVSRSTLSMQSYNQTVIAFFSATDSFTAPDEMKTPLSK
jgi:hypothetical protein